MSTAIVRLDGPLDPEVSEPPAERLIAGTPELKVRNFYTDGTQQFFAGRWTATRGKWRVRYTENELCVMTAGRVVIESDSGERSSFGAAMRSSCRRDSPAPGRCWRTAQDLRDLRGARLIARPDITSAALDARRRSATLPSPRPPGGTCAPVSQSTPEVSCEP